MKGDDVIVVVSKRDDVTRIAVFADQRDVNEYTQELTAEGWHCKEYARMVG